MSEETIKIFHDLCTTDTNTVINLNKLNSALIGFPDKTKAEVLELMLELSTQKDKEIVDKIAELTQLISNRSQVAQESKRKVVEKKKVTPKLKNYINEEISAYQDTIKHLINLPLEEFLTYIADIDSNIINYLILGLEKEIIEYQKMADEAYLNCDRESLELIKEDTTILNKKKQALEDLRDTIVVESESTKCNIIFLETTSGRICFLQDIENDGEVYEAYTRLLKSLQSDTPYKPKHFSLHGTTYLVNEMKDISAKIRVFFEKIADNTYIVIGGMRKKCDVKISYVGTLMSRYSYYFQNRESIIESLNNPEYLDQQHRNLVKVTNTLKKLKGDNTYE